MVKDQRQQASNGNFYKPNKQGTMIYGYLRVSSDEQDVNSQKQGVEKFAEQKGWEIEQYITDEGVSGGKDPDKRNLGPMLKKLKKDDIVIAAEISRLGRDLYMVMDILHFCMKTGCKIYTVKDNFALDDNIQSKVLAFAFGLAAEIERQMIRQRTREGLALRRKLGVLLGKSPLGRKSDDKYKCEPYKEEILKAIEWGAPIISIAKKIGVSKNAVYYSLARWRVKFDDAAAKRFYDNERKKNKRYRDAVGLRDHLQEVELPWEQVKELILQDKTIPEIHQHMPQYTYDQVYDSILCNDEMNILYRQHGQLRVKKRHYVNYKKTI